MAGLFLRLTLVPCGSGLAREGVLKADLSLRLHLVPLWERACSRWRLYYRPKSVGMVGRPGRFFRRALAVAGWEGDSLTFFGRCNSATGPGNPISEDATARHMRYCIAFLRVQFCFMAAVRGRLSSLPGLLRTPVFQPAHSCHPLAWKREMAVPLHKGASSCSK